MDSFKLGVFLMVIVCSAALASGNDVSKDNKKRPSKLKRLNEPKEDDTPEPAPKRAIGAGTVMSAAKFSIDVLSTILKILGDIERKIAIGVENGIGHDWEALNAYFFSGTSDVPLPKEVSSGQVILYEARKSKGPIARGCVGVMAYYVPALNKTLSVLFSVPYDYNLYSNWWNVGLSDGKSKADEGRYNELYHGDPFKGDTTWYEKDIGSGLKIKGSMASSGSATLLIDVKKE